MSQLVEKADRDATAATYRANCGVCGTAHELIASRGAIEGARDLMHRLREDSRFGREGKMFGVLVGKTPEGTVVRLDAFSGMLDGESFARGFVGPTRSSRLTAEAERETLAALTALSGEIASLDVASAQRAVVVTKARFDGEIDRLVTRRREQKERRERERLSGTTTDARLRDLEAISQREGGEIRALRRERRTALEPAEHALVEVRTRATRFRRERRERSKALQTAMHDTHGLLNFAGRYARLDEFFATGVPTGTGECCAPKLLHEAALRGIQPTGVAEFWWGPSPASGEREHMKFYPPCTEKCGPILGHLLCGLEDPEPPIAVLYEDEDLLAVDKPAGLLSVPGRTSDRADCVETRLTLLRPGEFLRAAHRLDQATSGVLLLARSIDAYRKLSAAFAEGQVEKEYRARVAGVVLLDEGEVRLPLRADLDDRPRQVVDPENGRTAATKFVVLSRGERSTGLRLLPRSGRTHQLRVHCASPEGLGAPIVGDRLYGDGQNGDRLMLHAERLALEHPTTGTRIEVRAPSPKWGV